MTRSSKEGTLPFATTLASEGELCTQELHNILTLSCLALGQAERNDGAIDEETYRFFTSPSPLHAKPEISKITHRTCTASPPTSEHTDSPLCPQSIPDVSIPTNHKRLEKLLPRPFVSSLADTTTTRKSITASSSVPNLSAVSLYQSPSVQRGSKRWAIFTYLSSTQPPTPKELFVQSAVKAISERLPVIVSLHSCYDPSFSLHLSVAAEDCEVILFFVDSHLQSTVTSLLETVQTFSRSSPPIEAPFASLGSVHNSPLRTLFLHTSTHEDTTIKTSLWQSLKALATLNPPQ
jgi:hypothetical protein